MAPEEAIKVLECGAWWDELNPGMSDADAGPLHEALDMAIAALRTQQEPNLPLTLDELREMDGDWVWIEHPDKDADCIGWAKVEVGLPGERRGLWPPHVYVVSENGQRDYAGLLLECGDKFYRHKLEKVTR